MEAQGPSGGPQQPGQPGGGAAATGRPGASWRVWQGSLSDDSRCREFPNDWEYFYFWACAQFPTESPASS